MGDIKKREYDPTYGLIRILACFSVVMHHFISANAQYVQSLADANVYNVIDNLLMCNNGLFFLLSGKYALAKYDGNLRKYYKNKR